MSRYLSISLTITCFFAILVCLGTWIQKGGARPIVGVAILFVMMIIFIPTSPEDHSS